GMSMGAIVTGGLMIAAAFLSWRAGNRSARLFLLAWGVLALGAVVSGMYNFGLLPTNILTAYSVQLSSSAEMLLLSFALAERIRLERNARESAQTEALCARQSLVETLRESEAKLEKTVAERTAELNRSLQNERSLLDRYVRFGALISHEFRNPLAIIKSQLALIEKERQHGLNHIERRLGAIASAAGRLGVLFEEWLQSDRLRRQVQEPTPIAIPFGAWLEEVVDDCRDCYVNTPIELHIADGLPNIYADEAMLRIAIHNLVDNAAKYAPAGTTIGIEALERDGMVGIAIIDRGPGIAPEHRDAIFADYFRSVPEGRVAGLGLGLAFVKKIVALHRGRIELESELGVGTGFWLWLPGNTGENHE
ncbi:MAG: HAMP domain-containing sensor histidine kinase, partial [Methylomonas sp.]|nr:HAMP domain-containing sensor histidine kinase [Methylomonas sp.]